MPFPLAVSDLWKMFEWANHRKAEHKEAVSEWLDSVYADLEDLSKVWFKICEALETANEDKEIAHALRIIRGELGALGASQYMLSGRLSNFYNSASRVLGAKQTADFHEDFVNTLGFLLMRRRHVRQTLDKEVPLSYLAPETTTETLLRMREQVAVLQQEVVSLQVLIKTFKAQR